MKTKPTLSGSGSRKTLLVVPSNRPERLREFLAAWRPVKDWDATLVVEDGPNKSSDVEAEYHYCWEDIESDLGKNAWIISRRDSAIRSYGFWKAWQIGADFILTLDDDCLPVGSSWCSQHIANLFDLPRWCESAGQRTRGIPYENLGTVETHISHGLWQGVPDLDAPQSLIAGLPNNFIPPSGRRLIPRGQFFPMCGMNLAFRRCVTPLMYFPLMGEGRIYRRFDDIWCGVIAKHICDHLGINIASGEPFIHHSRASNVFVNLVKEAPGIAENETAWERISQIALSASTPVSCMKEAGTVLSREPNEYWSRVGKAMQIWSGLFE